MSQRIVDGKRLIDSGKRAIHADCCCDEPPWPDCVCPNNEGLSITFTGITDCGYQTPTDCADFNTTFSLIRTACTRWAYSGVDILVVVNYLLGTDTWLVQCFGGLNRCFYSNPPLGEDDCTEGFSCSNENNCDAPLRIEGEGGNAVVTWL